MFQVVGQIVYNKKTVGLVVYNFESHKLIRATLKDCVDEVRANNVINLSFANNQLNVTDGSFSKLPVYDVNGSPSSNNLPVVIERVTHNGETVGYTLIDKGEYKKYKTADLVRNHSEFYNAKVVTKDNTTFISAKKGTFKELELNSRGTGGKQTKNVASTSEYVCKPEDYEISVNKDGKKVLIRYNGKDKKIKIPKGIDIIGDSAFKYCEDLISVIIPDSVKSIDSYAFYDCKGLKSIKIPDNVTKIGDYAFYDCTGLKSVTIGNSVISIGCGAFYCCERLTSITIPDSVTEIGDHAFWGCCSAKSVTIPNSVTSIGESAFGSCYFIESITIPNSVIKIGKGAFRDCHHLKNIELHNSISEISETMFYNCESLVAITIPNSVTSIGDSAFEFCKNLKSITIPNSVTSIGNYAFDNTGIASITIPDGVKSIGDGAFVICTNLTSISMPNSIEKISNCVFKGCTGLTSITIPDNVVSIGDYAFKGCTGLTSITIPDSVKSIGDGAFKGCTGITSVTIPDDITFIAYDTFSECRNLESVIIPNSIVSIGEEAFYCCYKLKNVTIPDGVTAIRKGTFRECASLRSITIPDSVTSIGDCAFEYCRSLESVAIPDSVTSIGDSAFYCCTELTVKCSKGSYAEQYCKEHNISYQTEKSGVNNKIDTSEFVCKPEDFVIEHSEFLKEYRGSDKRIKLPSNVKYFASLTGLDCVDAIMASDISDTNIFDNYHPFGSLMYSWVNTDFFSNPNEAQAFFRKLYNSNGHHCFTDCDGFMIGRYHYDHNDTVVNMLFIAPDDGRSIYEIPKFVDEITIDAFYDISVDTLYLHKTDVIIDGCADISPRVLMFDDSIPAEKYGFFDDNNGGGSLIFSCVEKLELVKNGNPPKCKILDGNIVSVDGKILVLAPLAKMKSDGYLTVPNGVEIIGSEAYSMLTEESDDNREWLGYGDLTVVIPDSVREINCGKDSQMECAVGTVVANHSTYAEKWAKENGIKFIAKSEFNEGA